MSDRRRLTLQDMEDASEVVGKQAVSAARKRLTLQDFAEKEKEPEPFEGGSTLKATVPLPGEWPTVDTGVPIGQGAAQFLAGSGKAFTDVRRRAQQLGGVKGAQQEIDAAKLTDKPLMETTHAILGNIAPYAIAGGAVPNTVRAAGIFGAGSGAMTPTTSEEGIGAELMNIGMGAMGGAGGQKLGNAAINTLSKVGSIARNKATGRPVEFMDPEHRRLYDLARQKGVDVSIGDIDPRSAWRGFEDSVEPLGTGRHPFLERQQDQLKGTLEQTRQTINKPVLDPATGQPVTDTFAMAKGLKDQYLANKQQASQLFEQVDALASQPGVKLINPATTLQAARTLVAERPAFFRELEDNSLWGKLMGVKRDTGPQTSVILQQSGIPFKKDQALEFAEVQSLRSRLGSEYRSAKGQDPEKARAFAVLLKSLDEDLDAWGQDTGNKALNSAYGSARSFYKENVVPYTNPEAMPSKSNLFSNVAYKDKIDTETIPRGVFKEGRQQLAQDFMDLANSMGQQGAKNELINEVIGAGLNPDTATGLSTAIIRHGAKHRAPGSAVFSPTEQAELQSAIDVVKTGSRAAGMSQSPPKTGFRGVPWAAASALAGGVSVPIYHGLNAMAGDSFTPSERVATSFVLAPLAMLAAAKGGTKYTQSELGKLLHFANPEVTTPGLGAMSRALRSSGKGAGYGVQDAYRRGQLGHRADEEATVD